MKITATWTEAYSQIDQFELSFDNKLTTLPILPVQWKIIFDFMPLDVVTFDNPATSGIDWQTVANILMIKIAIYCPQGSGTLRQHFLMMH